MKNETERKFLLANDDWRELTNKDRMIIEHVYIVNTPEVAIRISTKTWFLSKEHKACINIKTPREGITRSETEIELDWFSGSSLVAMLRDKFPSIQKVRHFVDIDGCLYWEIDCFTSKGLQNLTIAEVELPFEGYPGNPGSGSDWIKPEWIGKEVTDDSQYYNANLAENS
jgi:adenylate cyclase